ncbi:hypothetical protein O6H91_03G112800 [Diphasiastrum complanatum]|uniref:Uncharacterized protein n=1 Tax=Diphasiastrum complanatum TaxID=34168 RepID=A0ACC2EAF1_DIPCM|nr:hypothetical protein O6H91_03G112800 [Diphasiastrum complanatum]
MENSAYYYNRPMRIILVRHGESEGNVDVNKYCSTADSKICLTEAGIGQAEACGVKIRKMIEETAENDDWKVYFYVSPYQRTLTTLKAIGRAFEKHQILGVREEPRIREQDFGNFQVRETMKSMMESRDKFGRFFYRFPEGESAADVFDRVTSFLESVWRDIDSNRLDKTGGRNPRCLNLVIVSHGVTMRVFLMRWFRWTTEQFENLYNPHNCEFRVMQLGTGGRYSLFVHHSRKQLKDWGLSPEMIDDQEFRAIAQDHHVRKQPLPWRGPAFFDHLEDDNEDGNHCNGGEGYTNCSNN